MFFIFRVLLLLKALWIVLPETINILRNSPPTPKKLGACALKNFTIAIGLYLHSPPLVIVYCWPSICLFKDVWDRFVMSGVRMLHIISKFHQNSFKSTNTVWLKYILSFYEHHVLFIAWRWTSFTVLLCYIWLTLVISCAQILLFKSQIYYPQSQWI